MDALLIPRGKLLHRVQVFALTGGLGVRCACCRSLRPLRFACQKSCGLLASERSTLIELTRFPRRGLLRLGLWEESRDAFEKALQFKKEGDSHARATEGFFICIEQADLLAIDLYLDYAARFRKT